MQQPLHDPRQILDRAHRSEVLGGDLAAGVLLHFIHQVDHIDAVGEDEAKELYLGYSVPGAGEPLFQAASANINPWSEAKVDSTNPERGPMLIVSADSDHTVPWAIANASYKKQKRNKGVTEIIKMTGRGHSLTIDAGWREVAEKVLEFIKRFA